MNLKYKLSRYLNYVKVIIVSIISYVLSFVIRRKSNYVLFGSWCGEMYNDNSKYFAQYLLENTDYQIYWIGKKSIKGDIPSKIHFLDIDSIFSIPRLLKCKYMFFCQMHRADISKYNVYRNAILCCLDHGIPIKKWALDDPNYDGSLEYKNFSLSKKVVSTITGENCTYNFITVSSDKGKSIYESALKYRLDKNSRIILTGTPRNDFLLHITKNMENKIRKKISEQYGYDFSKIVISYLPTFRRNTKKIESFTDRNQTEMLQISNLLNKYNAVLLEKNHFASDKYDENHQICFYSNIIKIDKPIDFQELLVATDIQIADYSGGYLDYTLLDRPIIHYLYDYDEYKNTDSGLYYELDEFAAGEVVYSFSDLLIKLENTLQGLDLKRESRRNVRKNILQYEDGSACKKIYEQILKK